MKEQKACKQETYKLTKTKQNTVISGQSL